jgi:aspartate racemase
MKTLGMIGGIAPPSTIDYYQRLISRYRAASPGGGYPSLIIDSIDAARFFALLEADDRVAMANLLVAELGRLAAAGADVGLFASNTPHMVFDEVEARSPIPLISLVEETAKVASEQGLRRVGLLGARFTMEGDFYPQVFGRRGITVVVPDADDRTYVHDRYFAELVEGIFLDETRDGIAAVAQRLLETRSRRSSSGAPICRYFFATVAVCQCRPSTDRDPRRGCDRLAPGHPDMSR